MSGDAVDQSREHVAAALAGSVGVLRAGACLEAFLGALEGLIRDEGGVRVRGDDPLLLGAEVWGTAVLAGGGAVEPVPDQAAGVDGVRQHRSQGARGPVTAPVTGLIDVGG